MSMYILGNTTEEYICVRRLPAGVRSDSNNNQKNWVDAESASNSDRAIPSAP